MSDVPCVCPWCHTAKHVRPSGTTLRSFYCGKCQREFDDSDDGVVGYGNPEKYATRNERHEQAMRKRLMSGVTPDSRRVR